MRIRVNNGPDRLWSVNSPVPKLDCSQPVIIVIDPGKSNMAVLISTLTKEVLIELEFSGNAKIIGYTMDTTDYLIEVNAFLKRISENLNVQNVYIEQHILKKGNDYYNSMTVLTEVRASIIQLSLALVGKKPIEINNMAWKGAVLPDGYRGHNMKGSKIYLTKLNPRFRDYTDDMTDCYCILDYALRLETHNTLVLCSGPEAQGNYNYDCVILDKRYLPKNIDLEWFSYNPQYSIEDNCIYYNNRRTVPGVADLKQIKVEDIYKYAQTLYPSSSAVLLTYRR